MRAGSRRVQDGWWGYGLWFWNDDGTRERHLLI